MPGVRLPVAHVRVPARPPHLALPLQQGEIYSTTFLSTAPCLHAPGLHAAGVAPPADPHQLALAVAEVPRPATWAGMRLLDFQSDIWK